jgi:catechol 2,3-dioxygenase-like lactoylglutathione lyase family enzyme
MSQPAAQISAIDHVAFAVNDLQATCDYYDRLFGISVWMEYAPEGKPLARQIKIGQALLSLHQKDNGMSLVARQPTVGSADLCLRWDGPIAQAGALRERSQIEMVEGPVARVYSDGRPSLSVYFRDLDGNLIELMGPSR